MAPKYPRKAVIIEDGKGKVVELKDAVEDLAYNLKHVALAYVPDDFELPETHEGDRK